METENKKEIKEINIWALPDTVIKPDGYDRKTLPEATAENMLIYMNKINELVAVVNRLEIMNKGLITDKNCLHNGKINSGHHHDQPQWCEQCGEEL